MPRTSALRISYGGFQIGGSTPYRIHGPHIVEYSFEQVRLTAEVVVTANDHAELGERSAALELAFSRRFQSLQIQLGSFGWTFAGGASLLNSTASVRKSGNPETDRGVSRAYTVTVEGERPATDRGGLRRLSTSIEYADTRQRTVSFAGEYTSLGRGARAAYNSGFDREARTLLNLIDSSASWELVGERPSTDTADHVCTFVQDWREVIADTGNGRRLDDRIRNHRVRFSATSTFPGDAQEGIRRLQYVTGSYDCAVNLEETQDLADVFEETIKPHLVQLFRDEFNPTRFAVEEWTPSYDYTANRIAVSCRFIYQPREGSGDVVSLSIRVSIDEEAGDKYSPVHDGGRFSAVVDPGFSTRIRVWRRDVIVLGAETPKERIGAAPKAGPAGLFDKGLDGISDKVDTGSERKLVKSGWNLWHNTSEAYHDWRGDPEGDEEAMQLSGLSETVVERYVEEPSSSSAGGPPTTRRT